MKKVLKPAGPLITVASTAYDVHSGYSARRAIFTNLSGFGAGVATVAIVSALFTWRAWAAIGLGAVAGVVVGQAISPQVYDNAIMTARERLTQTPGAPDLDPGPKRLTDQ